MWSTWRQCICYFSATSTIYSCIMLKTFPNEVCWMVIILHICEVLVKVHQLFRYFNRFQRGTSTCDTSWASKLILCWHRGSGRCGLRQRLQQSATSTDDCCSIRRGCGGCCCCCCCSSSCRSAAGRCSSISTACFQNTWSRTSCSATCTDDMHARRPSCADDLCTVHIPGSTVCEHVSATCCRASHFRWRFEATVSELPWERCKDQVSRLR